MKIICKKHGAHFPEDLVLSCPRWKDWGMDKLSSEDKKKVWKWIFSLNVDELAIKYNLGVSFSFHADKLPGDKFVNQFEKEIPGYKHWSDAKKKKFQKDFYKVPAIKEKRLNWHQWMWERLKGNI